MLVRGYFGTPTDVECFECVSGAILGSLLILSAYKGLFETSSDVEGFACFSGGILGGRPILSHPGLF